MPVGPNSSTGKTGILGWVTALLAAKTLTLGAVTYTGTQKLNDNVSAVFGTDNDSSILHNGTDLLVTTVVGDVIVTPAGGDLILRQPGGVAGTDEASFQSDSGNLNIQNRDSGEIQLIRANSQGIVIAAGVLYSNSNNWDLGLSAVEWRGLYLSEDADSGAIIGKDQNARIYYDEAGADVLKLTGGAGAADYGDFEFEHTLTITGAVTDGFVSALRLDPGYTAATAQTVTRHNYIDIQDVSVAGAGPAAVTDACLVRFDAALGTHKATTNLDKTGNAKSGTIKVNVNGTKYHIQLYAE